MISQEGDFCQSFSSGGQQQRKVNTVQVRECVQ
jgi:hypothetical protein